MALLLLGVLLQASALVTCGGYVRGPKTQESKTKIDYSNVKVHLFNENGLLKFTTECAPNGYYFVPMYDHGSFFLQAEGPGWNFEPHRIPVTVKPGDEECADNLNFEFAGFSVSGRVTTKSSGTCQTRGEGGPAGVTITLNDASGKVLTTTTTDQRGKFELRGVYPGSYSVHASHQQFKFSRSQHSVTTEWGNTEMEASFEVEGHSISGNTELEASFEVEGHSISGRVAAGATEEGVGSGISAVDVFLLSTSTSTATSTATETLSGCTIPTTLPDGVTKSSVVCAATSAADGVFSFSDVPCGEYTLVAHYKREGSNAASFEVVPASVPLSITNKNVDLGSNTFRVLGFSLQGRVVDHAGNGISDVKISVNGVEKAVTDYMGYYRMDKLASGSYTIEASKIHYEFQSLKSLKLSAALSAIPDITPLKYDVCGVVDSGDSKESKAGRKITAALSASSASITTTDSKSSFCFQLAPGKYSITPTLTAAETSRGVILSPPSHVVTVHSSPILDLSYAQARVHASGSVKCVGDSVCEGVKVTLTSQTRSSHKSVVTTDSKGLFQFDYLIPGAYRISVPKDTWCWDKSHQDITVESADVTGIEFTQSGFILGVTLSHDIVANITLMRAHDGKHPNFHNSYPLVKGANQLCLSKPGVYELVPVSCYRFVHSVFAVDTRALTPLNLQASEQQVNGVIVLPSLPELATVSSIDLTLTLATAVPQPFTATFDGLSPRKAVAEKGDKSNNDNEEVRVYRYHFWAPFDASIEVNPVRSGDEHNPASSLLFYPRALKANSASLACGASLPTLWARPGMFVTGKVTPAVGGVSIVVSNKATKQPILTVITKDDGSYRAGAFYDDEQYTVAALKPGFHFVEDSAGHFQSLKLGQITIKATTADGKGLGGVMVSLTSLASYKQNLLTTADGTCVFTGLFPGDYFARVVMKEYRLEPTSKAIILPQSADVEETFTGTRVAYSVFGNVKSLNGEPEQGVIIEALQIIDKVTTDKGTPVYPRFEEATTDIDGNYRLLGLIPNSNYRVGIKTGTTFSLASPSSYSLQIGNEDQQDISFVALRSSSRFTLSGTVIPSDKHTADSWTYPVEVVCGSHVQTVTKDFPFFDFSSLPEGKQTVSVRPQSKSVTVESVPQTVTLAGNTHISITFTSAPHQAHEEHSQRSIFWLSIVILAVLAFFNKDKAAEFAALLVVDNKRTTPAVNPKDPGGWDLPARQQQLRARRR